VMTSPSSITASSPSRSTGSKSSALARAAPGRTTRRAALTRLQSSPANHQLTSTSKRLNVRGFPPGILLQLRVAVVARGNSMGSLTLSTLSTAAAAALPAAAGASWVCGAPGAADSRESFEPEHEATHTNNMGIWVGPSRQARPHGQTNSTRTPTQRSGRAERARHVINRLEKTHDVVVLTSSLRRMTR